jgi:hypothetical protein
MPTCSVNAQSLKRYDSNPLTYGKVSQYSDRTVSYMTAAWRFYFSQDIFLRGKSDRA